MESMYSSQSVVWISIPQWLLTMSNYAAFPPVWQLQAQRPGLFHESTAVPVLNAPAPLQVNVYILKLYLVIFTIIFHGSKFSTNQVSQEVNNRSAKKITAKMYGWVHLHLLHTLLSTAVVFCSLICSRSVHARENTQMQPVGKMFPSKAKLK